MASLKGSTHPVPAWLSADAAHNQARIDARQTAIQTQAAQARAQLHALHARHELPCALGDANRLQWVLQNVHGLEPASCCAG